MTSTRSIQLLLGLLVTASGCEVTSTPSGRAASSVLPDDAGVDDESVVATIDDESSASADSDEYVLWRPASGEIVANGYKIVNGRVIVDDMILGDVGEVFEEHERLSRQIASTNRSLVDTRSRRQWDGDRIRFRIQKAFTSQEEQEIRISVLAWNSISNLTGLRWVEEPGLHWRRAGVMFEKFSSGGCQSPVGQHPQRISIELGPGCATRSVVIHEMGHAMGLRHEQSRSDRNDWVRFFSSNYDASNSDVRIWDHLPRQYDSIGEFDVDSIMQYDSVNSFSRSASTGDLMPYFVDRQELSAFSLDRLRVGDIIHTPRFNRIIRLDGHGIDLDEVTVTDVDSDQLDDLVTESAGELVWSASGRTGWIPLRPGGQKVAFRAEEVLVGRFDSHPGFDVLAIKGTTWTLISSSGTRLSIVRNSSVLDFELGDFDSNGLDDVFVVNSDRTWWSVSGGDVLGPLVPRSSSTMNVSDVELVALAGSGGGLRVVAFQNGALVHSTLDGIPWQNIFASGGRGPLPRHATNLRSIFFTHIDGLRSDPSEPIDILTYSDGRDAPGRRPGEPVFVLDVLGSTATSTVTPVNVTRDIAGVMVPEMREERAIGYFVSSDRVSILTLGQIVRPRAPARSDALALGTIYPIADGSYLSDRYPLAPSRVVSNDASFVVRPNERVELAASFVSPSSLRTIRVVTIRSGRPGTPVTVLSNRTHRASGETETVLEVFSQSSPGRYTVEIFPESPAPANPAHTQVARWTFTVSGNTCGDGFLDPNETCDTGTSVSDVVPDACRTNCQPARCGDSVIDTNEQCDEGLGNTSSAPDVCRDTCSLPICRDGIVDSGEQCDDGNEINTDSCRNDCQLDTCLDGVQGPTEGCDDGNNIDNDGCRNDCTRCGDGRQDVSHAEQCDLGAANSSVCPGCDPFCVFCLE